MSDIKPAIEVVAGKAKPRFDGIDAAGVRTPGQFLTWLSERLVHVYGESPNADFVLILKNMAKTRDHSERFLDLSREMERHSRGQHFGDAMLTFPSAKFHEWCELGKLLESEVGGG